MKKLMLTFYMAAAMFLCKAQTNITQIEYFVDSDLGVGSNSIINVAVPDTDITQTITVPLAGSLSLGYHKLYVRVRDNNGNWSHTSRKNIQVVPTQVTNNVMEGEYFIDNDPQFALAFPVTISPQDTDIVQAFMAQIPGTLSIGYHKLYGRVKDGFGNWSHTFRRNIDVVPVDVVNPVMVIEYFMGNDLMFGNCSDSMTINPQPDGSWTFHVPYPAGGYNFADTVFIRVKDSLNNFWSHTVRLDSIDPNFGVGFAEMENDIQFSMYPNPATAQVTLQLNQGDNENYNFQLINVLGEIVAEQRITQNKTGIKLNYPPGIYMAKLGNVKQSITKRLVIQH